MKTPVLVLSGGLGSRLLPAHGGNLPKVLVPVKGKPFLFWKLRNLHKHGFRHVVVIVGHLGASVSDWLAQDLEARAGFDRVEVWDEGVHRKGTLGAIAAFRESLPDRFWITYGDSILFDDPHEGERMLQTSTFNLVMQVCRTPPHTAGNAALEGERLIRYDKNDFGLPFMDYGMVGVSRGLVMDVARDLPAQSDLSQLVDEAISRGAAGAFIAKGGPFIEIGTPSALQHAQASSFEGYV